MLTPEPCVFCKAVTTEAVKYPDADDGTFIPVCWSCYQIGPNPGIAYSASVAAKRTGVL